MALLIAASAWRLHFGIDLTDESYYVAMAYRFALGDRPFIDEFSLHQGAALLTYPALKAYIWASGGLEWVMLATRYLHLVFTVVVALVVFLVLRLRLEPAAALLAAAPCIAFVPFNIHNLGYYSLGCGLWTVALFTALLSTLSARPRTCVALAGVLAALAAVAFPILGVGIPLLAGLLMLEHSEGTWRIAAAFAIGCIAALGPTVALLAAAGPEQLRTNIESFFTYYGVAKAAQASPFSSAMGLAEWFAYHPVWGKLARVILRYVEWFPNEGVIAKVLFLAILLGLRKGAQWSRYALLAAPLLMIAEPSYVAGGNFVRNYALLAPLLAFFLWQERTARRLFFLVWVPSFVAGLAVSWGSGNGAYAAAIGFFPGSVVTTVYLVSLAWIWIGPKLSAVPALTVVVALASSIGAMVHDDPIGELDARVAAGPYRGISTTLANRAELDQLRSDLAAASRPGMRILCLYTSSEGYLLSGLRPATNGILLHSPADITTSNPRSTLDYYERWGIWPDVVVLRRKIPIGKTHSQEPTKVRYAQSDPLYRMVTGPAYRLVADRDAYRILVRR